MGAAASAASNVFNSRPATAGAGGRPLNTSRSTTSIPSNSAARPAYPQGMLPTTYPSTAMQRNRTQTDQPQVDMRDWDEKRSLVLTRILSAEEFLGRMDETDNSIRMWCSVFRDPVNPQVVSENELKHMKEMVGLRGHLQDELLRIEAMLAEDDPTLQCLREFENSYPGVVRRLITLRDRQQKIDQGQVTDLVASEASVQIDILPSSSTSSTGTDPPLLLPTANGHSSISTQSDSGTGSSKATGTEESEESMCKRHRLEEEQVSDKYAKQLAYQRSTSLTDDVQGVLDTHALHMQALRRRQQQERDMLAKKLRDKRAQLRAQRGGQKNGEDDSASDEDVNNEDTTPSRSVSRRAQLDLVSSIEFVPAGDGDDANGHRGIGTGSSSSSLNAANASSKSSLPNLRNGAKGTSDESGVETGESTSTSHGDGSDSDSDSAIEDSDDEMRDTANRKAGLRQTLSDSMWMKMNKMTPEDFKKFMATYRDEERSVSRLEAEQEKDIQQQLKAKREAFIQTVMAGAQDLSDEQFAKLLGQYTSDVNDLHARMKANKEQWNKKLREKLDKLTGGSGTDQRTGSATSRANGRNGAGTKDAWQDADDEKELQNELKKLDDKLQTELRLRRAGRDEPSEEEMRDLLARHDAEKRHLLATRAAEKVARDARLRDKLNNGRKNIGNVGEMDDTPAASEAELYSKLMDLKKSDKLTKDALASVLQAYLDNKQQVKRARRRAMRDTQADMDEAANLIKQHQQATDHLQNARNKQKALEQEKLRQKLQDKSRKNTIIT